ncbi:Type I secretion system, outer membrane component LapE [hydrothermal vent metagenome]|uniref:Type I secretion system, outer membrane component LapE n=1 Tax=hydrothermal vent metagenome TaxID=652676 RepID=A0A1W1B931_9ZZZZ
MKKRVLWLAVPLLLSALHATPDKESVLTLDEALKILKSKNLEIKVADLDMKATKKDVETVSGSNWGKLELQQDIARSNDAGNAFGFKLTSREATFRDFGFSDFLGGVGRVMQASGGDFGVFTNYMTNQQTQSQMLETEPHDLNYPGAQNFFQTKLKYEVPLFTGFQLSSYENIMKAMTKLKSLDKEKIAKEKAYQLKKSFYDMGLLEASIAHMKIILNNIERLEKTTQEMIKSGYAKKVDLLEVQAKKANVARVLSQMDANKKLLYHFISFLLNQKVDKIIPPTKPVPMPSYSDEYIISHNLDIQKAQTGLHITKEMISAKESSYYPMVGAFGEIATADDSFLGDANDHKAYTIGARLTWNIFNGGIDKAKIEKAKLQKLKTATQVELAKKGIALQVAKIRTQIESLDYEIASLQKEIELADAIYKNYEGRYKEQLASMNDVIIKQSQQIEKVLQLLQVQNKRTEKIIALEKLANGDE